MLITVVLENLDGTMRGSPANWIKENFCQAQVQVKFGSYQTFVQHSPLKLFSNMLPTQGGCKRDYKGYTKGDLKAFIEPLDTPDLQILTQN